MRTLLALAATSLLALSAPALAQNAGAPGAIGTGGSLTGSNTGTGQQYGGNWDQSGPGPNGYYDGGYYNGYNGGYMNEGRAAAPDMEPTGPDSPPMYAPQRPWYGQPNDER